jgi:hypothetical protein
MKIKTMIGLAAIGGFLYAHKRRGGEYNLDGFRTTARELWTSAKGKANQVRDEARETLDKASEGTGASYGGSNYSCYGR